MLQDQYAFCYRAALEYLGSFDHYANWSTCAMPTDRILHGWSLTGGAACSVSHSYHQSINRFIEAGRSACEGWRASRPNSIVANLSHLLRLDATCGVSVVIITKFTSRPNDIQIVKSNMCAAIFIYTYNQSLAFRFPIDFACRPYNTVTLPCERVI